MRGMCLWTCRQSPDINNNIPAAKTTPSRPEVCKRWTMKRIPLAAACEEQAVGTEEVQRRACNIRER